jgi:hypothetical protein
VPFLSVFRTRNTFVADLDQKSLRTDPDLYVNSGTKHYINNKNLGSSFIIPNFIVFFIRQIFTQEKNTVGDCVFCVYFCPLFLGEILMNAGLIPHGDTAGQLFGDLPTKTKGQSGRNHFLNKGTCLLV